MPVFSCGRSLYIDWRMVVVGGNCPTPYEKGGGLSGGELSGGEMSYTPVQGFVTEFLVN